MADTTPRFSGLDLKVRRVAADVTQQSLALAMGVNAPRISYIEGRRVVSVNAADRYLAALSTLVTNRTEDVA
jgi:transcriptional regulator with XRE-family HTH domain